MKSHATPDPSLGRERFSAYLTRDTRTEVTALAERMERSKSWVLEKAVELALPALRKMAEAHRDAYTQEDT